MGVPAKNRIRVKCKLAMPWFVGRQEQVKLLGILRPDHRERMFAYFKRYGCIRCTRKRAFYSGNGLCENCSQTIYRRLATCDKQMREAAGAKETNSVLDGFSARVQSARTLLADLRVLHGFEIPESAVNQVPPDKIEFQHRPVNRRKA